MRDHEEAGTGPSLRTSRRGFLKGVGLAAGATAVLPNLSFAEGESQATAGLKELGRGAREITLTVNGLPNKITVEPRTTLLEALRTKLDLTSSKEDLRSRFVRWLHGALRRQGGHGLHDAGDRCGGA